MKNIFSLFVAFVLTICMAMTASAQGKSYVGYSDGQIATSSSGKYTSMGSANGTVNIAIRLSKAQLAAYKGCNLVGVNYGMPTSQGVQRLNAWVRTSRDGADLTTGSTTSTSFGWREISVTPYTITGEESELWVGASYNNTNKMFVAVSFAGTTVNDGCWVDNGSGWSNYAGQGWGSLSLEAIIEGDNVAQRDLSLVGVSARQQTVQLGDPISVSGTIKNSASESATNPVIRYSINGNQIGSYTYNGTIAFRSSGNFSFEIPTTSITQECTANVELSLGWADGQADDRPADNVANFNVEINKEVFVRRMVVEEHTGAGCGWCPRGMVGLKEMKEKFGDNFIGIGIHSSAMGPDPYTVTDYNNFIGGFISGLPNSYINRSGSGVDPSYTNLYSHYQAMDAQADADIALEATYDSEGKINFTSHSRFAFSETNADYRVAFVVLENQLPITQANYYSGSSSSMGGFETKTNPCKIEIDDVARGIYPNPTGDKGSIPASVTKGEVYDYTYSVKPTFTNGKNVEVVALLINGKTGEIMNAIKTDNIVGLTSGTPVDPVNPGGGDDPSDIVPLSHTFTPAEGSTVSKLDKVVVTYAGTYSAEMTTAGNYNFYARPAGMQEIPVASNPYLRADDGKVYTAVRVWKTDNPTYVGSLGGDGLDDNPFRDNEFQIDFEGVPAGHYTLVVPKYSFVYYDNEDYLCGTHEFTAEYTVTGDSNTSHTNYNARFSPAEYSELAKFEVVTLYSTDDIYNYTHSDLGYHYNYFYQHEARRPYVVLPSGAEVEVKYADYVETTGVGSGEAMLQLTFSPTYTQGTYTVVLPDEYIVVCTDANKRFPFWGTGYAAPERRFTFFVGPKPEGIDAITTEAPRREVYDLWGRRSAGQQGGISIEAGRRVIR